AQSADPPIRVVTEAADLGARILDLDQPTGCVVEQLRCIVRADNMPRVDDATEHPRGRCYKARIDGARSARRVRVTGSKPNARCAIALVDEAHLAVISGGAGTCIE